MEKNIGMARELEYLSADERRIRDITEHKHVHDENAVIICTGAQGEPMSALSRMATGDHRDVALKEGDTVVLSSTPIPGNEAAVNRTIDNLFRRGVDVMYSGGGHEHVHVRGHAGQEELKTVIGLTRPRAFMPIHGEYRHLAIHARLAMSMGVEQDDCHILLDGDALELTEDQSEVVDRVPASYVYVDGVNVGGVDHTVLRDRRKLASDGVVVVVVPIDHQTGQLAGEIDLVAKGFGRARQLAHPARRRDPTRSRAAPARRPSRRVERPREQPQAATLHLPVPRGAPTPYGDSSGGGSLTRPLRLVGRAAGRLRPAWAGRT